MINESKTIYRPLQQHSVWINIDEDSDEYQVKCIILNADGDEPDSNGEGSIEIWYANNIYMHTKVRRFMINHKPINQHIPVNISEEIRDALILDEDTSIDYIPSHVDSIAEYVSLNQRVAIEYQNHKRRQQQQNSISIKELHRIDFDYELVIFCDINGIERMVVIPTAWLERNQINNLQEIYDGNHETLNWQDIQDDLNKFITISNYQSVMQYDDANNPHF